MSAGLFAGIDKVAAAKTLASVEELAGLVVKHFADEEKLPGVDAAHKARPMLQSGFLC